MISAEDYDKLGSRSRRKMMNDWEYGIKRGFRVDAAEHRKWFVDIPGYLGMQVPDTADSASNVSTTYNSPGSPPPSLPTLNMGMGRWSDLRNGSSPGSPPPSLPSLNMDMGRWSDLRGSSPSIPSRVDPGCLVLKT